MAALLTHAQEVRLAQRIERGDLKAKEELIEANIGLPKSIANKAATNGQFDDLFQEGLLGLIRAVEGFDWRLGYKFSTYAHGHISGAVKKAARDGRPSAELSLDFEGEGGERYLVERIEDEADVPVEGIAPETALSDAERELTAAISSYERLYAARDRARVCRCGCEESLVGRRPNVRFHREACRSRARRQEASVLEPIEERVDTFGDAAALESAEGARITCRCSQASLGFDFEGEPACVKCGRVLAEGRQETLRRLGIQRARSEDRAFREAEFEMKTDRDGMSLIWGKGPQRAAKPWRGEKDGPAGKGGPRPCMGMSLWHVQESRVDTLDGRKIRRSEIAWQRRQLTKRMNLRYEMGQNGPLSYPEPVEPSSYQLWAGMGAPIAGEAPEPQASAEPLIASSRPTRPGSSRRRGALG